MLKNLLFNTFPSIVHANGPHAHKPYWQPVKDKLFSGPQQQYGLPADLTIITWNNGHKAMGIFEQSMDHLGIPCVVLGQGVEVWRNSYHKPMLTYEALKDIKTEYIMGVDSRDAVIINDPKVILQQYKDQFDCDLVFSADLINWPSLALFRKYEDEIAEGSNSQFRYLNSGAFIGRTSFCRDFFKQATELTPIPGAEASDQGVLKQLLQETYPKVQMDYRCVMFQNIGTVWKEILEVF